MYLEKVRTTRVVPECQVVPECRILFKYSNNPIAIVVCNAVLYVFEAKKICKKKHLNKLSLPTDSLI